MESLVCLKDHLEVTMSENNCLMAAVDEFSTSLKRSQSLGPSAALATQTDFFREQMKLLNRRISENIANIDAASEGFPSGKEEAQEGGGGGKGRRGGSHESQLCRLGEVRSEPAVKDLRRATVLEAVEYLCEDEGDKRRILGHLERTEDESTLRLLEGVICKKYVEVRLLEEDMRHHEEEAQLRRLEEGAGAGLEERRRLLEMDLPVVRGETQYVIDEFDVEVDKFRSTVSEIAEVQRALREKSLEIRGLQERLAGRGKRGNRPCRRAAEAEGGSEWSKVPSLLRAAKERNLRLQGLVNDHTLRLRATMAELGRARSKDREEIETELLKVARKLHGAMEVVHAKGDEAAASQRATLQRLEELHGCQEQLLEVLAVVCENLGDDAAGDTDGEARLDELRGEVELLEAEFRARNARALDLMGRFGWTPVSSQVARRVDAARQPQAVGGFASFRRRISVLREETVACKRELQQCLRQHEEGDAAFRRLRQLARGGESDGPRPDQELKIELLEKQLVEAVERNSRMAADVEDILATRARQVEELGAKLAEAEWRLEKSRDVLEAVNLEEDLDPETVLAGTLKAAKARLSGALQKIDSCSQRVAEMLEEADGATRRGFLQEAVKELEVQQLYVNKKTQELFEERKDRLYRQFVTKSGEFEEIHRQLEEVRRAKVRLEGRGDVDELQRLLHDIKELKLQMLLNARRPAGDVGQWLGRADEQRAALESVAQDCEDFEKYVASVKENLALLHGQLKAAHREVTDLRENLVHVILDDDYEDGEEEEGEVGEELMVRDLMTKILEGRVVKWQSGGLFARAKEVPGKEEWRESSVTRVETWQRCSEGSETESKVLEMCLKVDIMQDEILNRLESANRDLAMTTTQQHQQQQPARRRTRTRWINTDGLAGTLLLPGAWARGGGGRPPPAADKQPLACLARQQNTVLKALLKHSLTRTDILREALAKTKVANVEALPRHRWLKENTLLRDLVAQLMDELLVLQAKVCCR